MKREKFSCKSHRLQATESPSVSSGLVWTAPLCTWIYYAIHVRVYINCYVERARALYQRICIHIRMYLSAEPWLSRGEYFWRAFIRHCRERSSWNDLINIEDCNIYDRIIFLFLNLFYDDIWAKMKDAFNKKLWSIYLNTFIYFYFFHICKNYYNQCAN